MKKEEIKNLLKKTEEKAKEMAGQAGKLLKEVEKEATYTTKKSKVKVEQFTLESERKTLISKLGEKVYPMLRKEKVEIKKLKKLVQQIQDIENQIRGKKGSLTKMKKKRRNK
ncbi:MAG: hypothetical protein PF545_04620 [Elusimicrobia bacterium]|jgi:arsenate reductase-like glutaredoxin family protein|nr:hypothetical protein [Elusimicrobiota bacterium]